MAAHSEGKDIYERMATMETHMRGLIGNGQPGRIEHIEKKLDKLMWMILGVALTVVGSQHGADVLKWFAH